jgi:hypothetical protein
MALPTWKHEETHDVSKAIVGAEHVHNINFEESRETGLASNLTDADLSHILTCVDAVNNLQYLYLTDCFKIEGHGLEPLWGSSKLCVVDLSLVGRSESPRFTHDYSLSMDKVISVLDSIIRSDQCALEHVQFPKFWRENYPSGQHIQFRNRYKSLPKTCNRCFEVIRTQSLCYNVTNATRLGSFKCFDCREDYCRACNNALMRRQVLARPGRSEDWATNEEGNEIAPILFCEICEKGTCQICEPVKKCRYCHCDAICRGCMKSVRENACEDCWLCFDCRYDCDEYCDQCLQSGCECKMKTITCECCGTRICSNCLTTSDCEGCGEFKCVDCFGAQICDDCGEHKCLACAIGDGGHLDLDCLNCLSRFHMYHK